MSLRAGLGPLLAARPNPRIVILVSLGGFAVDQASTLPAATVEEFIDVLLLIGPAAVAVASSSDSSSTWAGNRDVYAWAELNGYRYATPAGNTYDIIDLGAEIRDGVFPAASALVDSPAAAAWLDADLRIVFASLKTDAAEGFSGALAALVYALPLPDKTLEYRQRREIGDAIIALLDIAPPHFALIDTRQLAADASAAPGLVIASCSALLADLAAGLKLGLDPLASRLVARVAAVRPLAPGYHFNGSLAPLDGFETPTPIEQLRARAREAGSSVAALTDPWLRHGNAALFPHLRSIDAKVSALIAELTTGDSGSAKILQVMVETLFAVTSTAVQNWQTMFAKDHLVRRIVPLGLDPSKIDPAAFGTMVAALDALAPIARDAPDRGEGLRWRKFGGATVFAFARQLAIPFDTFVATIDAARTIQYMNDYIGGVIVPVAFDKQGRAIRQAERNLYLPQPNYLTLYGGQPIDVTKIETVRRRAGAHQLYWTTLFSSNGSADADDGIATFSRRGGGTHVEFIGKQDFTLPPFWQLFDLALIPAVETALTTHAYRTFFDRTLANFEALVEGRDIRIGIDPSLPAVPPVDALKDAAARLFENAEPWLTRFRQTAGKPHDIDTDGFVHVTPVRAGP